MGKHHRSLSKQSSASSAVQALRSIVAKNLTDSWNQESHTQLKQWLLKYLPSIGLAAAGTTAWKEMRDSINTDLKLLEKLVCVFQDMRDSSTILLMTQLFGELMNSKRAAKLLVQSGLTLAVLCQIRVCCCLSSNSNINANNNAFGSNWTGVSSNGGTSAESISISLSASLSLQCSLIGNESVMEKQTVSIVSSATNCNSNITANSLQCSPQVALALHQLACRIFPLDSRYNTKARATGAILGTLLATKALFLDRKALPVLLCCLRFYLNSSKNWKLLGANGMVVLMHRLIGNLLPRQTRLMKLAVELLVALLKSSSNCLRLVQAGGCQTLLQTFETVHRSDSRCRQLQVRRIILRCMLMLTQIKQGRAAILQCNAVPILYQICKDLPARQELDGLFFTCIGIIKTTAGPRRLPINSLHSPYSFDSSQCSDLLSRSVTNLQLRNARKHPSMSGLDSSPIGSSGNLQASSPARSLNRNPSTDDESIGESDEEDVADEDYAEESDFVAKNCRRPFLRNSSGEDRVDEEPDGPEASCLTAADDSDSDCGDTGAIAASQEASALPIVPPLESDPVVLASYDMFFPEIRDLSLTNTALISSASVSENLTLLAAGGQVLDLGANSMISSSSSGSNVGGENAGESFGQVGQRINSSNNSNGIGSPQRRQSQLRKSTGGKPLLSRRGSEMNESASYGYVSNSMTMGGIADNNTPSTSRQGISSFLPLSLIGEHISMTGADRIAQSSNNSNSSCSSGPNTGSLSGFSLNRDTVRFSKLYNANKRLSVWNKIPYPCLHGFLPLNNPEPQLALPSGNMRRIVMSDCDRFLQKQSIDIINEVVYDLDSLIALQSIDAQQRTSVTRSNSSLSVLQLQMPPPSNPMGNPDSAQQLGNDDMSRIGRPAPHAESSLLFNSQFECGNLRRAIRVREYEYDLILTPDVSTNHHLQWFYFEVYNTPPGGQPIRFNILNCEKPKSQYEKGMQVLAFSVTEAAMGRPNWRRVGCDVCYYKNYLAHFSGPLPTMSYYTMTFSVTFEHAYDVVYLAYHYPYSYTNMLYELENIQNRVLPSDCYFACQTLCTSEMGNNIHLLTITSNLGSTNSTSSTSTLPGISQSSSSLSNNVPAMLASMSSVGGTSLYRNQQQQQRPYVILTSRVHPGETNSSWMMRGVIAFLLSDTQSARRARQSFVFKIVPMLNPDGVINGNHRCSLYGDDLNRSWTKPSPITAPSIFHTKRLLAWLRFRRRPILCFVDFHGHSRKKNVFFLGCSPGQSWRRRDIANPAVDPVTGEEDSRWRLLPVLLATTSPAFSLQDCCFMIERAKEPTGRVVCWRQVGLIASYTLEATFCGFDQGSYRGLQVTPVHLQEVGADLCRCFEPLLASIGKCPIPNPRYGENFNGAQVNLATPTGSSSFAGAAGGTAGNRLVSISRNIGLAGASCDEISSSSSSSCSERSVRDDSDIEDAEDPLPARRTTIVAAKNITFVTKKY